MFCDVNVAPAQGSKCQSLSLYNIFFQCQNWPTGLRDIHIWKCKYIYEIFSTLKGTYLQSDCSDPTGILNFSRFYAILVTSKFDEDPIKNERLSFGAGNIRKWTVISFSIKMFIKNKCRASLFVQYIIKARFPSNFNFQSRSNKI